MQDILLLIAKTLSYKELAEMVEEGAKEYRLAPTDDHLKSLVSRCLLMVTKEAMKGKNILEESKKMDRAAAIMDRMEGENN